MNSGEQRRLLAERLPFTRQTLMYGCAAVVAGTIWLWPHLLQIRHVPDRGDPVFSAWRLARFAHQLANDPLRLLDGNIFHPLPLTLTYSDATILQGFLGAPLIWAGVDPLIASNLLFLLAFPACAAAFFYLGWRITGDPRCGVIAGVLGAWYPFHGEHYSHLELQWFMFVPLAVVAALRVIVAPGFRTGAFLGVAVGCQWLASMYFGLMLATFMIPFAVVAMAWWRIRPTWRHASAMAAAVVIASAAVVPTAMPYLKTRAARGDRSPNEVAHWSAIPADYLATHRRLATYHWRDRSSNRTERELFPGVTPIALAAVGGVVAPGAVGAASIAAGGLAFDGSLGTNGVSFPSLYSYVPPFRGIRVPARFALLVGCALIILATLGVRELFARLQPSRATIACVALSVLILIDLRLSAPLVAYWPEAPAVYAEVSDDMVLAEFPRGPEIDYMYFSTRHWARLVGGYSGFMPADPELDVAFSTFPATSAVDALRARGVTHLTYNCFFERSPQRCQAHMLTLDANPGLMLVSRATWQTAEVRLYRLR